LDRPQSTGEEIANSISHGAGFIAALLAAPVLLASVSRHGSYYGLAGAGIFAIATLMVYLTSTLYHAMPYGSHAKQVFAVLDHAAIFLLIAGTYTPFTLGVLRGAWGWSLFGVIWSLAITGICLKVARGVDRHHALSLSLYLGMGWLIVVAARVMWLRIPLPGLLLLLSGGIAYTAGVPFYVARKKLYAHFVWHLFVLGGTTSHFLAVLWYAN
jgi:hemolysin III